MDKFWYENPKILIQRDRLGEFWPSKQLTSNENMNAITRFVLYSGVLLTIYKNDPYFLLITVALCIIIALLVRFKIIKGKKNSVQASHQNPKLENMTTKKCKAPTIHNPFGNVLMTDYTDEPDRAPACESSVVNEEIDDILTSKYGKQPFDVFNRKINQRQYSMPNTQIPNDSKGFATWLYGSPNKKHCKEDYRVCTGTESGMRTGGGTSGNN